MKNIIIQGLLILITFSFSFGQEESRLNSKYLDSKVLEEKREVLIYLPENYSENKAYPVIYLTDGGTTNFEAARNYLDILSKPIYDAVPQCILVGIIQQNRNAELDVFGKERGKKFINFIFNELVPYVDNSYNTSGFNTMIGHSDGAEVNHHMMLTEGNPFRGFISISTNFNTDLKEEVGQFMKSYEGAQMYYFIANGTQDAFMRTDAGNAFAEIYKNSSNDHIDFKKETYQGDHQSIVALSLLDGLTFIFKDYKNIEQYATAIDYGENYLSDLKEIYGIDANYDIADTEVFFMDIIGNKKLDEYHYLIELIDEHKLFFGSGIDPVNRANHYYAMEMYPETIEYYNKAVKELDTIHPQLFYANIFRVVKAYKIENRLTEAVDFLEKSKHKLPEKYTLRMNYRIAKLCLDNQIELNKGKAALEYCKTNYEENKLFTMDNLLELENKL
ncbi:alpha/beta hydrolase [Mangrovivirga cuniculi]|uniref:Esterase n=1 Tax=Mangrovivirga cuniculi TaxID=2715131 RepID=A0A4D7K9W1_9BACT|nr:alpha/beta hydrolase-fold protein [Mangrovivirga cuniculi]QCK16128.1 hypothetical protein DCC35_15965 [Mangrovivirga cuniculi]